MRLFETIRANITARMAAEHYGVQVRRNGMACCPFHDDKHPSMKLDKRYHCFGCQADGDAIDFVRNMFGLPVYEAARKLAEDFELTYEHSGKGKQVLTKTDNGKTIKDRSFEQRMLDVEKKIEKWILHAKNILLRYQSWLKFWKEIYKPEESDSDYDPLFLESLEQIDKINYYLDVLYNGTDQERLAFSLI